MTTASTDQRVEQEPTQPSTPETGAELEEQEPQSELRCTLCGLRACWTK
jgi:hypothetical protein